MSAKLSAQGFEFEDHGFVPQTLVEGPRAPDHQFVGPANAVDHGHRRVIGVPRGRQLADNLGHPGDAEEDDHGAPVGRQVLIYDGFLFCGNRYG